MKLTYNPYRGKAEPIIKVEKAEVHLTANHIEVICNYSFKRDGVEDFTKFAAIYPKQGLCLERGIACNPDEMDKEIKEYLQIVSVRHGCDLTTLRCSSTKEADNLYLKIKDWIFGT